MRTYIECLWPSESTDINGDKLETGAYYRYFFKDGHINYVRASEVEVEEVKIRWGMYDGIMTYPVTDARRARWAIEDRVNGYTYG